MGEQKQFTMEELLEMNEMIKKLPPITEDPMNDYVTFMLKEMIALGPVWKEYFDAAGEKNRNHIIENHMRLLTNMYNEILDKVDLVKTISMEAVNEKGDVVDEQN